MAITKIKSTQLDTNIFVHYYNMKNDNLSVRTYRFGRRPAEQVITASGHSIGYAANKSEFIDLVHWYMNK